MTLTVEQIEEISERYVRKIGEGWSSEPAIAEGDAHSFARDIIAAYRALEIESAQADMLRARSILLRWCNDGMNDTQIKRLRHKTLEFCAVKI